MHLLDVGRNDTAVSRVLVRDRGSTDALNAAPATMRDSRPADPLDARRPATVTRLMSAGLSVFALRVLLPGWAGIIDEVAHDRRPPS